MPPHTSIFIKRNIWFATGKFDTSLRVSADYDFILRLLKNASISVQCLDNFITVMSCGGVSNGSLTKQIYKSWEDLKVARRYFRFYIFVVFLKVVLKVFQFIR